MPDKNTDWRYQSGNLSIAFNAMLRVRYIRVLLKANSLVPNYTLMASIVSFLIAIAAFVITIASPNSNSDLLAAVFFAFVGGVFLTVHFFTRAKKSAVGSSEKQTSVES